MDTADGVISLSAARQRRKRAHPQPPPVAAIEEALERHIAFTEAMAKRIAEIEQANAVLAVSVDAMTAQIQTALVLLRQLAPPVH